MHHFARALMVISSVAAFGLTGVVAVTAAPALTFAPPVNYPVSLPIAAGVQDVNQDGNLDLLFVSTGGHLFVLLGNGDGSFRPPVSYRAGGGPGALAIGDLNGDGKPDVAIGNFTRPGTVAVMLGNGDGSFRAAVHYVTGNDSGGLAIGDLNRDGRPDLAVANTLTGDVSVLLGNGDGTFRPAVNYPTGGARSVAIADLNADGKLDLAVVDAPSSADVAILLGTGEGTFNRPVIYPGGGNGRAILVVDLNADRKPDIAVSNNGGGVAVLLGAGDGTFGARVEYAARMGPQWMAASDLNSDGSLDLAVANSDSNDISVLLGRGDGTLQPAVNLAVAEYPFGVAIGDLNKDGKPDLVGTNFASSSVSVLLNTSGLPTCRLSGSGTNTSGQQFIRIAAQDTTNGLRSIVVTQATNATVAVPAFQPGTKEPVVVTATKTNQSLASTVMLRVTSQAGLSTTCDPVLVSIGNRPGARPVQLIRDLPRGESRVTIVNGTPGVERVRLLVNWTHYYDIVDLHDGEVRQTDIAAAMRDNTHNTLLIVAHARWGTSATVLVSDM